jgi:hypothetical protein
VNWPYNPQSFAGLKIIESLSCTIEETVIRTWKERLFSWPWKPFKKFKTITKPNEGYFSCGDTIVCHPQFARKLREALEAGK